VAYGKKHGSNIDEQVDATLDNLLVQFGSEILKIIPGKVSTEVDARFSFDTKASVEKALHIIDVSFSYLIKGFGVDINDMIAIQRTRHRQIPYLDQARQHMGRH
jgi:hypothetical protein